MAIEQLNEKIEVLGDDADARRMRLKTLIILGKDRGYLTYAEINDHLPDDVQDSEQIDGIIGMINDMGIQVYEEAPDAEVLLMSDSPPAVTDEDAVAEAEQALSTVDSEFGRTTDPVRMYMREMGTVDLLTREGEIEIAKRIEDGLKHMVQAIAACPTTIAEILPASDPATRTGRKCATGVNAPVRPICDWISSTTVVTCSAGNFCLSSRSMTPGFSSFCAKSRADLRMSSCSSFNLYSILNTGFSLANKNNFFQVIIYW